MYARLLLLVWFGVASDIPQGFYTKDRPRNKLDVVVVEATDIKEDGSIVPGASVGATPELVQMADKVKTRRPWARLLVVRSSDADGCDASIRSSSK